MSFTSSRLAPPPRKAPPDFGLAQVNIVLLLVLFFLVVGTIVETDELQVDLSETSDLPLERLPRPLLLIRSDAPWALDGATVTEGEAIDLLSVPPQDGQPNAVYILAPKSFPADRLVAAQQRLAPTGRAVILVTLRNQGDGE